VVSAFLFSLCHCVGIFGRLYFGDNLQNGENEPNIIKVKSYQFSVFKFKTLCASAECNPIKSVVGRMSWRLSFLYMFIFSHVTRDFTTLSLGELSDDFFSSDHNKDIATHRNHPESVPIINNSTSTRIVEQGKPCVYLSYTKRKFGVNQTKMERLKNLNAGLDRLTKFENIVRFEDKRCPPEDAQCPKNSRVINVTLSRPEQKEGSRLVGDVVGDVFPCYPLSDADFFRSRSAVPGDSSHSSV
jgi:hypothetical protein